MAGVFVNYRSSDEPYGAILIDQMLVARFGEDRVFRDSRAIPVGSDFPPILWRALQECQVLLVVIGPRWLEADADGRRRIDNPNDYVRRELAVALDRGVPVIPLLLGDMTLPKGPELPADIAALAKRQYRHIRQRTAEQDIEGLLTAIERWVPRRPADARRPDPTRADPSRPESSRTEPSRTEPSRTEPRQPRGPIITSNHGVVITGGTVTGPIAAGDKARAVTNGEPDNQD